MTSRERVLAAIRREQPDRVPFDFNFGFTPYQLAELKRRTGYDDPKEYFQSDLRSVGEGPGRFTADFSAYVRDLPLGARVDEWGIVSVPTESDDPRHSHLEGFVYPMLGLRTVRDLGDYPPPDVEAQYRYESTPGEVAAHHARGLCAVGELMATIFEIAWWMRGMEQLMIDFIDNPEFASALLDRITDKRCIQARYLVESGVDYLHLADDISGQRGMLMSMPMWRKWLKPRLVRVIEAARSVRPDIPIAYHTDGNPTVAIPELIEIGVDLWDPVQPECVDPKIMKQMFGDRLSFLGCIGTQRLLPFGTPDEIRHTVRDLVDTVGNGGGLILASTHAVEPEVPWENIVAFVDAVREYEQ